MSPRTLRRLNEEHDQSADDEAENLKLERNRVEQEITGTLTAGRHNTAPELNPGLLTKFGGTWFHVPRNLPRSAGLGVAERNSQGPAYLKLRGGGGSGSGTSMCTDSGLILGPLSTQYDTEFGQKITITTRMSCIATQGSAPQ